MRKILTGIAITIIAAIPVFAAQAQPNTDRVTAAATAVATAAATAPAVPAPSSAATCKDSAFIKAIDTDFASINSTFSQMNAEDPSHLIASAVILSGLRQKYEDNGSVDASCFGTQLFVVTLAANINDLVTLKLGALADPANAATYTTAMTGQTNRVGILLKGLKASIGVDGTAAATLPAAATPEAIATAAAVTTVPVTCKDAAFLKGISTDFTAVGAEFAKFNTEDATHLVASSLILTALRQKYENMNVDANCFETQLYTIALAANLNDWTTIKLFTLVDKANAANYANDLTNQVTRITTYQKLIQASAGIASK